MNASIYALSLETVDSPPGLPFLLFDGKGSVAFSETRVCQISASGNLQQVESPASLAVYEMKTSINFGVVLLPNNSSYLEPT